MFDIILLSYTEQTFGVKAAYKITKNIEVHDNSFDFIEKLKEKVFKDPEQYLQDIDFQGEGLSYSGIIED